jgi:aspartate aminotransferase
VGSPFFSPPPELLAALREAAGRQEFDYAPSRGLPELRRKICDLHGREGLSIHADQVVVTHGSKGGLLALFACLLEAGDEVVYPVPTYPAYPAVAEQLGARAIPIPQLGKSFEWSLEELESRCSERTRVLVLSSPSNPSGATLSQEQAGGLVDYCRSRGIRLVLDEAYEAFRFDDRAPSAVIADPNLETVVLLRSFSKSLAVCGWRIGYVATDGALATRIAAWQSALLNPPNSIAQQALSDVTEASPEYRCKVRAEVATRLQQLASVLRSVGLEAECPSGGFYLWVDLREQLGAMDHSSVSFCREFAERSGLVLWPGEDYGAPGWVRLSAVACQDDSWDFELRYLQEELRSFMGERKR